MKDAKGHGSDPRGAHSSGIDQVGRPETFYGPVPDITSLPAAMIKPMNQQERNGAMADQIRSGKSPAEWARTIDLSEPVDVSVFKDGTIKLSDGHHRQYAGEILKQRIPVNVQAINAKHETLDRLRRS